MTAPARLSAIDRAIAEINATVAWRIEQLTAAMADRMLHQRHYIPAVLGRPKVWQSGVDDTPEALASALVLCRARMRLFDTGYGNASAAQIIDHRACERALMRLAAEEPA